MSRPPPQRQDAFSSPPAASSLFALVLGLFLVAALLKWGAAIVTPEDSASLRALGVSDAPSGAWGILYDTWPLRWSTWMGVPVALLGIASAISLKKRRRLEAPTRDEEPANARALSRLALALPAIWAAWNLLAGTQSADPSLASTVVIHFSACAALFYLGYSAVGGDENRRIFFVCLVMGLLAVLSKAMNQHFGEFEATRALVRQMPNWRELPPLFLIKLDSNRVFGTMGGYPNALAGLILLLLPLAMVFLWSAAARLSKTLRVTLAALPAVLALPCLYWSGSKAGCLLVAAMAILGLWLSPVNTRWKRLAGAAVLVAGIAAFGIKLSEKGAASASARLDYWTAALRIAAQHPVLGAGPGAFGVEYHKIKPPEAEMARVCHNDYLEQACDSGLPGFLIYAAMIPAALLAIYRGARRRRDPVLLALWLGLLGLFLHSASEFHLYVPALAWPAFALMGLGLAQSREKQAD